jgi:hypothetical protein
MFAFAALPATAAQPAPASKSPSSLTVNLDFKGVHSSLAVGEMQREAAAILLSSGVRLDWSMLNESFGKSFSNLVVMTLKGTCEYEPAPPRYDELGPYAMTKITDGEVQPFGEVDCDRVVSSARTAMSGSDFGRADQLVGRALGRVIAHELVHMITKSTEHGKEGVEEPALSGHQLIAAVLPLSAMDITRVRHAPNLLPLAPALSSSKSRR